MLSAFQSFRYTSFRYFISYRFLITFVIQMQAVAAAWWLFEVTHSAWELGLLGLTEAVPSIAVSLFAGYLADKYPRKRMMMIALSFFLLNAFFMCLLGFSTTAEQIRYGIYFSVFLSGLSRGILAPASTAMLSQVVNTSDFANAATWSSWCWQVAMVGGPVAGGLLYAHWGIQSLLFLILGLCMLCLLILSGLKPLRQHVGSIREGVFKSIRGGMKFVAKNQIVLGALSLDMFAVFFGGAVAMLPAFAREVFFVGPAELGILRAAPGIGSVTGILAMTVITPGKRAGRWLLMGVFMFGVSTLLFALTSNYHLALLFLAFTGLFDSISVVIRGAIIQIHTPDEMRGRVSAINSVFIGSSNELGAFESGFAARFMGLVPSVIFGGCMTLVVVALAYYLLPRLRNLEL